MEKKISEETIKDSMIVIEQAIKALKAKEINDLESLSNRTIHNATTEADSLSLSIPKLLYSIFKVTRHSMLKNVPIPYDLLIEGLIKLHDNIGLGQISVFEKNSIEFMGEIQKIASEINLDNVVSRAGVKKGSKIYDHGISIAQAAESMSVSQWELYPYIGKTKLNDYPQDIDKRVKKRLEYTRGIFL